MRSRVEHDEEDLGIGVPAVLQGKAIGGAGQPVGETLGVAYPFSGCLVLTLNVGINPSDRLN